MAVGLEARVTIVDKNNDRLSYLDDVFMGKVSAAMHSEYLVKKLARQADLLVKSMQQGSVMVDVAIDPGGSVETIDRITTNDNPYYEKYGVIHYSVANMPGAVPKTSTQALMSVILPYILEIANKGVINALKENKALLKGPNTYKGSITYKPIADCMNADFYDIESVAM